MAKISIKKKKSPIAREQLILGWIFIAPILFGTTLHFCLAGSSLYNSFFEYDYANPPGKWVGFRNYIDTLTSPLLWTQIKNTLIMYGWTLLLNFPVPIIQAILLNEIAGKKRNVLRYLYILPCAIPAMSGMAVWRYIFDPDSGVLNSLIGFFGIPPQTWLYDEKLIHFTLAIPGMMGGGMGFLMYLIVIEGVPKEMYEAAEVDGATRWQQLIKMTLPNIAYMVKLQLLLNVMSCLMSFDSQYIYTDGSGGPNKAAETVVFGIYNKAYDLLQYDKAMATSIILMGFMLILLLLRNIATKYWLKEE